jgi:hypothetical protein
MVVTPFSLARIKEEFPGTYEMYFSEKQIVEIANSNKDSIDFFIGIINMLLFSATTHHDDYLLVLLLFQDFYRLPVCFAQNVDAM